MPTLRHFYIYLRKNGLQHKQLYLVSLMLFFWSLFDGIVSYITPLLVTEGGFSKTQMGIIIGSSSIAGAFFDFIIAKFLKKASYRRMFALLLIICFIYPLILWHAKYFWVYLIAMVVWGLYYDLQNFGTFDFISKSGDEVEHSSNFGVVSVFKSLGYIVAPILTGFVVGETLSWKPFITMWIFIILATFFYAVLIISLKRNKQLDQDEPMNKPINFFMEIHLWEKIGKMILPVLILTMLLNVMDAFFWTVGPIFSENITDFSDFSGLFVTAYMLPTLLVGWFVDRFTTRLGKKKTAYISFMIGCLLLMALPLIQNFIFILILIFVSSTFTSLALPSINGAYADYISESHGVEKEIEGVEDLFTNAGYIIGPMLAGFLADTYGNALSFAIFGAVGFAITIVLMKVTPRKINIDMDLLGI